MKLSPSITARKATTVWDLDIQFLKGVGEKLATLLAKADIKTLWDLLLGLPRTYEDRRHFHTYSELLQLVDSGHTALGTAVIENFFMKGPPRGGRRWIEATASLLDEKGEPSSHKLLFTWFNDFGGSIQKRFAPGMAVIFRGKLQSFRGQLQMVHPDLQKTDALLPFWEFGGFIPVYREVSGISTKTLRKILALALEREEFKNLPDGLPAGLRTRLCLSPIKESLKELHFPKTWEPEAPEFRPAGPHLERLAFEELFMMALALHMRRAEWRLSGERQKNAVPLIKTTQDKLHSWISRLPYALTGDQKKVIGEILQDMSLKDGVVAMHRLIQGDVGSGKTIVAFIAAMATIQDGYQAVIMAPTEILADQHYRNFCALFPETAHECCLLKGALSEKEKKEVRASIVEGRVRFVIGTQALLSESTLFQKLGLIVVDEQHRFGVEQRLVLKKQGVNEISPHLLVMTATPFLVP